MLVGVVVSVVLNVVKPSTHRKTYARCMHSFLSASSYSRQVLRSLNEAPLLFGGTNRHGQISQSSPSSANANSDAVESRMAAVAAAAAAVT